MLTAATVFLILTPPRRCSDVDDPHISCAGISTVVPLRIRRPSARRPAHCASIASTSGGFANPHDNQSWPWIARPTSSKVSSLSIFCFATALQLPVNHLLRSNYHLSP